MAHGALTDAEIEDELSGVFGFPDGTVSEDGEEDSDIEVIENILSGGDIQLLQIDRSESGANTPQPGPSTSRTRTSAEPSKSVDSFPVVESTDTDESDEEEISWKKVKWGRNPDNNFDNIALQMKRNLPNRSKPIAYFEDFFDAAVFDNIIIQTNLFASQTKEKDWTDVTVAEVKAYIGMLIQMAMHKVPTVEDYWSSDPLLCVPQIAETMTLKRFQKITKCLLLNDNEKMAKRDDSNFDKLYKIRPLVDQINLACQKTAKNTNSQSIDECMIRFKGRSGIKQYMPLKPIKRGFKVWARADSKTGYMFQFQIYTGKSDTVESGLGSSVVKSLCQPLIEEKCKAHVCFDNFFSSYELLQYLYEKGLYSTATARIDRQDMPILVKKPKSTGNKKTDSRIAKVMKKQNTKLKKLNKGDYKWRVKNNVAFFIWKGTKLVTILSTAFHPKQKTYCRRTQKDGSKSTIPCPLGVVEYTKRMGGVDRFDQKRSVYGIGRRSRKWWMRIFYFLLDVAVTNAFILYSGNSRIHNPMRQKDKRANR